MDDDTFEMFEERIWAEFRYNLSVSLNKRRKKNILAMGIAINDVSCLSSSRPTERQYHPNIRSSFAQIIRRANSISTIDNRKLNAAQRLYNWLTVDDPRRRRCHCRCSLLRTSSSERSLSLSSVMSPRYQSKWWRANFVIQIFVVVFWFFFTFSNGKSGNVPKMMNKSEKLTQIINT